MNGKIKRKIDGDYVRLHEAVSDSVYLRGDRVESQTLTDFVSPHQISLLHLSDIHASNDTNNASLNKMVALLAGSDEDSSSNDVAGINTGDLTMRSSSYYSQYNNLISIMENWNNTSAGQVKPILFVKGNHDAYNSASHNEGTANTSMLFKVNDAASVTYGQVNGANKGYWYKDFAHHGVKLRIIGLDEYQYSVGVPADSSGNSNRYSKVYSQAQMEWLVATLLSTPSDYYIIMAHHQPLYAEHPAGVLNDFVHHGIVGQEYQSGSTFTYTMFTYREGNIDLPARVVDAYLHKRNVTFTISPNGVEGSTLTFTADFRDATPATFACHINGHVHGEYCEYHPDYPEQLCLTIACSGPTSATYSDVTIADWNTYVINRVTIDADRNVVRLQRIGADTLKSQSWVYQDGSARKAIEFPIKPVAVEPTPANALATYCPIVEDKRTSVIGAITADAPFASLEDGQRVLVELAQRTGNSTTLNLTLSNGTTTGAIGVYSKTSSGTLNYQISDSQFNAGQLLSLVYVQSTNRWMCLNLDRDTTTWRMSQSEINNGKNSDPRSVPSAQLLVDNFQKHTAIETMPSGAIAPTDGYEPNKMYDFGKVASVNFATYDTSKEISGCVNLYMCTFQVASGGTTLSLNANIKYPNGDDGTELTNLLTTEDRVFEITIRDNKLSYIYFD